MLSSHVVVLVIAFCGVAEGACTDDECDSETDEEIWENENVKLG